jgi:hypothetical protein
MNYKNIQLYWHDQLNEQEIELLQNDAESFVEQQLRDYSRIVKKYLLHERECSIDPWCPISGKNGKDAIDKIMKTKVQYDPDAFSKAIVWYQKENQLSELKENGITKIEDLRLIRPYYYEEYDNRPISVGLQNLVFYSNKDLFVPELLEIDKYEDYSRVEYKKYKTIQDLHEEIKSVNTDIYKKKIKKCKKTLNTYSTQIDSFSEKKKTLEEKLKLYKNKLKEID